MGEFDAPHCHGCGEKSKQCMLCHGARFCSGCFHNFCQECLPKSEDSDRCGVCGTRACEQCLESHECCRSRIDDCQDKISTMKRKVAHAMPPTSRQRLSPACTFVSAANKAKCFHSDSLFRTPSGTLLKVAHMSTASSVVGAHGEVLQVVDLKTLQEDKFVSLRTPSAALFVTDSHRVITSKRGTSQTISAGALRVCDDVVISGGVIEQLQEVLKVTTDTPIDVLQITFCPDLPLEVFQPMPTSAILSKGHGRASTRRSKKPTPSIDTWSIPETEDSFK